MTEENSTTGTSATTATSETAPETVVLLVGHGSRNRAGNEEIEEFARQWCAMHLDWQIDVCFIEYADVLVDEGIDRAAQRARRVVVVPLILNAAGHVNVELPEAVDEARQRHPGVEFILTRHLGMNREIFQVLQMRLTKLMKSLDSPDPQTTGVVLLGRGSSDADANGELARMARWVFEGNDHELVDLAFTGITWPRLERVVQRQALLGMKQICIIPVYLFTGVLIERIKAQTERLKQQYPHIAFALGKHFGFEHEIFDLLDARAAENEQTATSMLECDGCKYREVAQAEHLHDHSHTGTGGCGHATHSHDDHQHDHSHCQHAS